MQLKIRHRDGVESLMTLEEGEFKIPIGGCINNAIMIIGVYNILLDVYS